MALDMDREGIEQKWVLPAIETLENSFLGPADTNFAESYAKVLPEVSLHKAGTQIFIDFPKAEMSIIGPLEVLNSNYRNEMIRTGNFPVLHMISFDQIKSLFNQGDMPPTENNLMIREFINHNEKKRAIVRVTLGSGDAWWLNALGVATNIAEIRRGLLQVHRTILNRERKKEALLDEFFPIEAGP